MQIHHLLADPAACFNTGPTAAAPKWEHFSS